MAPLTKLSSVKLKFEWSSDAHFAFCKLDTLFSTAPLLVHLDPELQFAVEVDISDSGVGAVLSQCSPTDQKLHPCAFILAVSRLNGIPQDNVSDRGPQFASQVWRAFYQAVGASASLSPGCHPLTNGQIEQANQDLASFLRCVVSPQASGSTLLSWVEYAHDSLVSSVTGTSPVMVMNGFQLPFVPIPGVQHSSPLCSNPPHPPSLAESPCSSGENSCHNQHLADLHHIPAPEYEVGQ